MKSVTAEMSSSGSLTPAVSGECDARGHGHRRDARIGRARAAFRPPEHFDPPQPFELLETLDEHHVDRPELSQQDRKGGGLGGGGDARPAGIRGHDHLGGARQAMPVAVFARHVELDVVVVRVFDGRDGEAPAEASGISRSISVVLPLPE